MAPVSIQQKYSEKAQVSFLFGGIAALSGGVLSWTLNEQSGESIILLIIMLGIGYRYSTTQRLLVK